MMAADAGDGMQAAEAMFGWRELGALLALGAGLFGLAAQFELFELAYEASRAHEDWQLDELILLVPVLAIVLAIFTVRRVMQLRRSILARQALEAEARRAAVTNRVTGLPNDHATIAAIDAMLRSGGASPAALFVVRDPTRREVERLAGLGAGDQPCRAMIERLRKALPARAVLGSLDNELLLVFLTGLPSQSAARNLLDKLLPGLNAPLQVGAASITPHVKIGASMALPGQRAILPVLDQALAALDQNLRKGENGDIAFFDAAFEAELVASQELLVRLKADIASGSLDCAFQPINDLLSGSTVAFEALARWQPAGGAPVPPDVFIPMIERAGLIPQFTDLMLEKALACARTWPKDVGIAINLSSLQLGDADLPRRLFRSLQTHGVSSSRVELELTEHHALHDNAASQQAVTMLRSLGVKIVVDDFGAGHANFSLLHDIHFDGLKVDRRLVKDIRRNVKDRAMVEAIQAMAAKLKRELTIEGVEDEATAQLLLSIGCRRAQGYHLARPMPASQTLAHLQRRAAPLTSRSNAA